MVDPENKLEIGASIPGVVAKDFSKNVGDKVTDGQLVAIIEAMKMETQITVATGGIVSSIAVKEGQNVEAGELLMKIRIENIKG